MLLFFDDEDETRYYDLVGTVLTKGFKVPTTVCHGVDEIQSYLASHRLSDHDCIVIHGSLGRPVLTFTEKLRLKQDLLEYSGYTPAVRKIVETIRAKNPFVRVVIYSDTNQFPLAETVHELQADGFLSSHRALTNEQWAWLANRGPISAAEMQRRGQSVEDTVGVYANAETPDSRLDGENRQYRAVDWERRGRVRVEGD